MPYFSFAHIARIYTYVCMDGYTERANLEANLFTYKNQKANFVTVGERFRDYVSYITRLLRIKITAKYLWKLFFM